MHDSNEYGVLRWELAEIAQAVGCQISDLEKLIKYGVLKGIDKDTFSVSLSESFSVKNDHPYTIILIDDHGPLWYSSRMVRDEYIRQRRAAGGAKSLENPNVPQKKSLDKGIEKVSLSDTDKDIDKDTFSPSPSSSSSSSSSKKEKEEKDIYIYPESKQAKNLFDVWNSLKIIEHREFGTFKPHLLAKLKHYSGEEIREAMENYKAVLVGDEYFFSYRWSLAEFLTRKNGFEKFLTRSRPFDNFKDFELAEKEKKEREKATKKEAYDKKIAEMSARIDAEEAAEEAKKGNKK